MTIAGIPKPQSAALAKAGLALGRERHIFAALQAFHDEIGDIFQLELPGFRAVMMVGPEANRLILVEGRERFLWRPEGEPVTELLRDGVLVLDGAYHDSIRQQINPSLHKRMVENYPAQMVACTDQISQTWGEKPLNMLDEMRKIALLILTDTLFGVDFSPQLKSLWDANLKTLKYISPGLWVIWRGVPRPGYGAAIAQMDAYLYGLITARRKALGATDDLLGSLIEAGLSDALIRDQLLTMLIAGHDTSTALLAWALYLIGRHPEVQAALWAEIDAQLGGAIPTADNIKKLKYLRAVIDETLRLYPPIHLGSRIAAEAVQFQAYCIPKGTRIMYSIYLSHRHKAYWEDRHEFKPERWLDQKPNVPPYTYLPFGGGARNCIGAFFAQIESLVVLARLLQRFEFVYTGGRVHPLMQATLEPRPGVMMRVLPRKT